MFIVLIIIQQKRNYNKSLKYFETYFFCSIILYGFIRVKIISNVNKSF